MKAFMLDSFPFHEMVFFGGKALFSMTFATPLKIQGRGGRFRCLVPWSPWKPEKLTSI